jgi:hypothetical protein
MNLWLRDRLRDVRTAYEELTQALMELLINAAQNIQNDRTNRGEDEVHA